MDGFEKPEKNGLNPITKVLLLVIFSILVLLIVNPFVMLVTVIVILLLKIYFRAFGLISKGIFLFAVAIFIAQIFFNHSGELLYEVSMLRFTTGGVSSGLLISGRFFCLVMMSWIFISTTTASDLSTALISAGFPYRFAFLPALSMRFVPTFQFEFATVKEAQMIRGLRLEGHLRGLIKTVRYTMFPMLFSAVSRVNSLVSSMEGRGFGAHKDRTLLHPNPPSISDAIFIAICILLATMIFLIDQEMILELSDLL